MSPAWIGVILTSVTVTIALMGIVWKLAERLTKLEAAMQNAASMIIVTKVESQVALLAQKIDQHTESMERQYSAAIKHTTSMESVLLEFLAELRRERKDG